MNRAAAFARSKPSSLAALLLLGVLLAACSRPEGEPADLFRAGEFDAAYRLFSERAAAGDLAAINFLGIHHYLGTGVERDFALAADFFERAALANHADAQRNLGIMYMNGLGVPKDNQRAYGWFFQAYSGGNRNSREYLRILSDNVTPNAGAAAREWAAAQVREYALKSDARAAASP